jgi:hypothetical protein
VRFEFRFADNSPITRRAYMSKPELSPKQHSSISEEATPCAPAREKLRWEAPELTEFGPIHTVTRGVGFRDGDGLYNRS